MAIYSSKRSDNQALSHSLSNSPWLYKNLSRSVRAKAIEIIGKNGVIILDKSGIKNLEIALLEFRASIAATWER